MKYKFVELAKPLVTTAAYAGDAEAEAKQSTSMLNQLLDSGWRVWSTHTMTVGAAGYIVYVLRGFNMEHRKSLNNKGKQGAL